MIGSEPVEINALQISVDGVRPSKARPFASAKARKALSAFSPSLPSISPGEKPARSRRTCTFTTAGSILSFGGGLPFHSALLIVAASNPAIAGPTRQTRMTSPASQRFKAISEHRQIKHLDGPKFPANFTAPNPDYLLAGPGDGHRIGIELYCSILIPASVITLFQRAISSTTKAR